MEIGLHFGLFLLVCIVSCAVLFIVGDSYYRVSRIVVNFVSCMPAGIVCCYKQVFAFLPSGRQLKDGLYLLLFLAGLQLF